jgi:two-component system, OmpR family, phosphate regulon response regulator PhoB
MTEQTGQVDPAGSATILVVEDEPPVRQLISRVLGTEGFTVVEAADALTAVARLADCSPDLVLLDVNLPGASGFDVLAHVRRDSDVPVIMLTGAGAEEERIAGLREGADDYVLKPFSPGELVARIHTVLRRSRRGAAPSTYSFDGLAIDARSREVRLGGSLVQLTAREFDLLAFLASSPRQVFSREQLLRQVWGSSSDWQDPATVTEHVRRVRRKIEPDPDDPRWVHTVRGVGYRFEP